jgi:hypothetical protein
MRTVALPQSWTVLRRLRKEDFAHLYNRSFATAIRGTGNQWAGFSLFRSLVMGGVFTYMT